MIELVRAAARSEPERAAVITNERSIGYAELARAAGAVAGSLSARSIERFAVIDQDAGTVLALLAGASLAGAQACVYPPVRAAAEARDLAGRFDHHVVVSDADGLSGDFDVIAPGELTCGDAVIRGQPPGELTCGDAVIRGQPPRERPLLILTTGTTGAPRGVCHDWWRVLRSAAHIRPTAHQRWLLAYGLQQFAGLQILVHVVAARATLVAPSPRRPRDGLAAMRRHAVDRASATPTFWRFLLAEQRSDGGPVPELEQITLGGEAVPEHLLAELRATFPRARVSQIYAANESGSMRSVRDGRAGLPLSLLNADDDADIAFKVVDGELWVRSHIGMLGYWGEAPVDPDAWRPTGDLVEVEGDRVVFRGRSSEIINVGGVKVHPLPIEERIGGVPGVSLARVYGRPNPMTGAIVAAEVVASPATDTGALDEAIREACSDLPAAARPRSIRFVEAVATPGEKIARQAGYGR